MVDSAGASLVQWQAGSLGLWEPALRLEPGSWSGTERAQEPAFVGACLESRTMKAEPLAGWVGGLCYRNWAGVGISQKSLGLWYLAWCWTGLGA